MIPQRYHDATAVLIAGGPSLTEAQVEACREPHRDGLVVLGCNDAYRICDFLDLLYAADGTWVEHHHRDIPPHLECWTADVKASAAHSQWNHIRVLPGMGSGLSRDRQCLMSGGHSGYQLINIAYLMGCSTIILIGYDGTSGGHHWFGQHPDGPLRVDSNFSRWLDNYKSINEPGLTIINATPGSAITAFPSLDIHTALSGST